MDTVCIPVGRRNLGRPRERKKPTPKKKSYNDLYLIAGDAVNKFKQKFQKGLT